MRWSLTALKDHGWDFASDLIYSTLYQIAAGVGTVLLIASQLFGIHHFQALALIIYTLPAGIYYARYRPFGIQVTYTPTSEDEDNSLLPDKIAEEQGNAYIQNGHVTIVMMVKISDKRESFNIKFNTVEEIDLELRDTPQNEHTLNNEPLILSCDEVTTRRFPVVLEVYTSNIMKQPTSEYPLKIKDMDSGRDLLEITLVPR